ncbi:MAG TPA: hypothetical protein VIM89_14090 [Mucilaginibacter sp.]
MNIFLRAKHWHIFLVTIGLPILFEAILMITIFSSLMNSRNIDPTVMFGFFKFFPIIMLLFMGGLFGWFWSVAIGLQKMIPPTINMKVTRFKIFFFIPLVYISCIIAFMGLVFGSNLAFLQGGSEPPVWIFGMFAIFFPIHFFSMFCIFYCIYFVAKTIKTVELQREVTFGDFVGEFFLVWFHFIGIWILQPRINKIVRDYDDNLQEATVTN